jgi:glutamate dehydrogenase/leucine dehydrogenase
MDEYSVIAGNPNSGFITGKPLILGGSPAAVMQQLEEVCSQFEKR